MERMYIASYRFLSVFHNNRGRFRLTKGSEPGAMTGRRKKFSGSDQPCAGDLSARNGGGGIRINRKRESETTESD